MGKGSNVQKAQQARERNQSKLGKTDEERKAATDKAKKDAQAFMCELCRQTFMVNVKPPQLLLHVTSRHDGTNPKLCFPVALADYVPPAAAPAAGAVKAAPAAAAPKVVKKKVAKKDDLSFLDSAVVKVRK